MHSDQSFSSKEGCQFPTIPGAQLQLWAVGIASVGIGPEILHWEHMAAHPHQLSPPGPTSDPSPQLSTALVQMGKVRHLVVGSLLTTRVTCSWSLQCPHSATALCCTQDLVATHQSQRAHPCCYHTHLPIPSKVAPSPSGGGAPAEEAVKLLALAGRQGPGGEPEGRPGLEARALPEWQ